MSRRSGVGMDKRQWLNVGLLMAAVALAGVAWYQAGRPSKEALPPLSDLAPGSVNKIEIIRAHDNVVLIGQNGMWWMREPVRVAANRFEVENVLGVLSAESLARFPAAGRDLAAFGLAHPEVRLRFNGTELAFGGLTPVDQRRYVQVGNTVHLITDRYFLDLTENPAAFASRNLVPEGQEIAALALPDLTLTKSADGKWHETPGHLLASADAVQALLAAWRDAQALHVEPYQPAAARGEVTITLAGQPDPLLYVITAEGEEWVLARPDVNLQFRLGADQARRLLARAASAGAAKPAAPTHE